MPIVVIPPIPTPFESGLKGALPRAPSDEHPPRDRSLIMEGDRPLEL